MASALASGARGRGFESRLPDFFRRDKGFEARERRRTGGKGADPAPKVSEVGLRRPDNQEGRRRRIPPSRPSSKQSAMKKRIHVYFSGMVQGVGFRFTAEHIANNLGLSGWVKNLRDGRVELVAEGDEGMLKELVTKIRTSMGHYVRGVDIDWLEASGEFQGFDIAFDRRI